METYFIFDSETGDCMGEILAISQCDAEEIAAGTYLDHPTDTMEAIPASAF